MKSQETLGQRLRDLRIRRGISQAQLAFPELSDSYVSLIESNKRVPARAVIELLAGKLGCSASFLESGVSDETVANLDSAVKYGEIALQSGEVEEARASFAQVVRHPDLSALPELMYEARWGYGLAQEACGNLEEALAEFESLLDMVSPEQDPDRWAWLHIALCRCHREQNDFSAGIKVGEEGLRRLIESHPQWMESTVMLASTLLGIFNERGDLVYARQLANRLIQQAEEVGTARARAAAYWEAGAAADYGGDVDEALRLEERALALLGETDDARNIARLHEDRGRLLLRAHPEQAGRARDLLLRALQGMAESAAGSVDDVRCLTTLAKAEIALDRPSEAVKLAHDAIARAGDELKLAVAEAMIVLAHAYLCLDRQEDAAKTLEEVSDQLENMDVQGMYASRQAAQVWFGLAELLGRGGDQKKRLEAYRRACACAGLS